MGEVGSADETLKPEHHQVDGDGVWRGGGGHVGGHHFQRRREVIAEARVLAGFKRAPSSSSLLSLQVLEGP